MQGKFLKREKYLTEEGKFLTAYDIKIGETLLIYGKQIQIYSCDGYTREFYSNLGVPQMEDLAFEEDQWSKKNSTKFVPKKDTLMKEYLEKKLGGGKPNSAKQFLQNDRKVLKFYAQSKGVRYIVHFFLADDTLEVR